jgi:endogenous inhibitor of DNA gyrase (YacG/DUF329 family)
MRYAEFRLTEVRCEHCGCAAVNIEHGKPRRFCSGRCQVAAWRKAHARVERRRAA